MRTARVCLLTLTVAVAATALASATVVAAPKKLALTGASEAETLKVGEDISLELTAPLVPPSTTPVGAMVVESSNGTLTCPAATAITTLEDGPLQSNSEVTDLIAIGFEAKVVGSTSDECSSPSFEKPVEVGISFGIVNLTLSSNGKALLKSTTKSNSIDLNLFYPTGLECTYSTRSMKGTVKLEPWTGGLKQVSVSLQKQKMKLLKKFSPKGCATEALVGDPLDLLAHPKGGGSTLVLGHLM